MSEVISAGNQENQAKVVDLEEYRRLEEVDPSTLADDEVVDLLLSAATHPSVNNDPHRMARQLQGFFSDSTAGVSHDWINRTEEIRVNVADIDDDTYDQILADEVAQAGIMLIRSKNGHYKGNEDIVAAVRALIDLRAYIVLNHPDKRDDHIEKWRKVIDGLGKTAVGK